MSALAKVFVVLIFLLSVVFFGVVATLFLTREDYRTALETLKKESRDSLDRLKDDIEKKRKLLEKQNDIINMLSANEETLIGSLQKMRGANDALKAEIASEKARADAAVRDSEAKTKLFEGERQRNADLNGQLAAAVAKADSAVATQKAALEERNRMKADLDKANSELAVGRTQYASLTNEYETLEWQLIAYQKKYGETLDVPPPPIDALVQEVDPSLGLVVLSAGKDQKVKVGYEFTVYRQDQYVGKVRVIQVFEDMAGAEVVLTDDGVTIQQGDRASTDLRATVRG